MIFSSEWTYLLTTRIVAGNDSAFSYVRIKYGNHATDTVTGVIIYPDDFSFADAGAPMLPFGATYGVAQIEKTDWEAFEAWGCVFLPGGMHRGYGAGRPVIAEAGYGLGTYYWSASATDDNTNAHATSFNFNGRTIWPANKNARYYGFNVRLAQDYR